MATKKKTTERASTSRERRLALALRAVLDALKDAGNREFHGVGAEETLAKMEQDADALLTEFGYGSTESVYRRLAALNEQLTAAVVAGDGKEIARLGLELERAKAGRSSPVKLAAPVAKKSSRKSKAGSSPATTETETAIASSAADNANGSDAATPPA